MTRITPYTDATQHRKAGPYSPVLRISAGDLIVISGQGPLNDDGELIGSNIAEQTRATLANCAQALAEAGVTLDDVFKVNVFLADLDDWPAFNAEYVTHFSEPLPVRTAVGTKLLLGMLVEIEMWAAG